MRSDTALAERFAAGDEAAFDVIYERHRPVVLAVCMGVLGAPADAEDATQETFSALAVALRTRPPAELRPWLIRVARNASIDTTRRRRHRLLTIDGEIPEVAARPASSGKAELAVVLDGIRELPEGQRMALLMRELGGHSYSEIAEFLDTDEESVKGLIARARVGLRTYREATELSCASARSTIAAEPDGRRYDKTIRRHLRTCGSCRSYREALRDDAKALRAALPIQAGTVATGSLTSGMLTAAKGSLLSYGLTQAATTCAASACAVGAIGGMVFVAPVHRLGLPPILPAVKTAPAHKHHTVAKAAPTTHVELPTHMAVTVEPSAASISEHAAATPLRPAPAQAPSSASAVARHRHHEPPLTRVTLPKLPPVHRTSTPIAPVSVTPTSAPVSAPTPPSAVPTDSTSGSTTATQGTDHPTGDPGSVRPTDGSQPSSGPQPTGDPTSQPGADSRPVGGDHHGGPVHVIIGGVVPSTAKPSASTASASTAPTEPTTTVAPGDASTTSTVTPTTTPGVTPTTVAVTPTTPAVTPTTPVYTRPVPGSHSPVWQRDQSPARHAGGWHGTATAPVAVQTTSTAAGVPSTASTSSTPATYGDHGWPSGSSLGQQYGRSGQTGPGAARRIAVVVVRRR